MSDPDDKALTQAQASADELLKVNPIAMVDEMRLAALTTEAALVARSVSLQALRAVSKALQDPANALTNANDATTLISVAENADRLADKLVTALGK